MAAAALLGLVLAAAAAAQESGDCNKPPSLENGSLEDKFISQKTFQSGSRVTYRCDPGYSFTELSRRYITCNGGVWGKLQATCQPKSCGSPGEILNGYYEGANTYGSKVIFHCDTGYQMVGRNYRLCEADGWSGQVPTCEAVKCPDIPPIENGRSPSPSSEEFWEYGMVAEFTCSGDYSLIGERTLTCENTGEWSNSYPVCKDVKCRLPSIPDTIRIISPPSRIYKYQDKVTFQCNEGYQMVGESVIVCGENNEFSPQPPTCKPRDCNKPPSLENGSLEDEFISQKTFQSGSRVTYRCDPGYSFTELSRRYITCDRGVWEKLQATCQPKSCGSPGEILNGYYKGANTYGSKVIFHCDTGYRLVGRNYRLCEADGWSGQVPTCEAVKCPDIPPIENGRSPSPSSGEFWEYGMVAEFTCSGDYSLIGERTLTCENTGEWSNSHPVCKDVKCQIPSIPDTIRIISPPSRFYKYQDEVTFQCEKGYEMVGKSVIVCGENNEFSPPPPSCKRSVKCQLPSLPDNIRIISPPKHSYEYQDKVTFQCNEGYQMVGESVIECGEDNKFSPLPPTCQAPEKNNRKMIIGTTVGVLIALLVMVASPFIYKKVNRPSKTSNTENGEVSPNQMQPLKANDEVTQ